ncbi:YbaB/EbfC family nucleoid-associated protein [Schaalia odontolytica]|uniref:YbaB/EbfC family nucleoid-associated protein n=1 Tax=Schaalia odontolytica TaxID=1660 RepID=UPI001D082971|nr:YbaB/EbfC family nucleoid-associated protein [Schaalia odontolytica]MCB6402447.1 YbaB/EbfC family nucleoid-associated protein [Schaalia odontolytica]
MDNSLREAIKESLEVNAYFEMLRENSPEQVFGTSEDGLVEVTIDRDGKLVDCRIAEDWAHSLEPEDLEAALNEALANAQSFKMQSAHEEIERKGLSDPEISDADITDYIDSQQRELENYSSFYLPRESDQVAEDILALADKALNQEPLQPPIITVQINRTFDMIANISLNYDWAERRGGSMIARAIMLASSDSQQPSTDPARSLLAESLGLLSKWSK